MRKEFSRREILILAGISLGSAALAACDRALNSPTPNPNKIATATRIPPSFTSTVMPTETATFTATPEVTATPEKPVYPYFSQSDPNWQNIPNTGKGSMWLSGCSIATGAMTTFTDPYKYWGFCTETHGSNLLLPRDGWSYLFHDPVLRSHGFDPDVLEGDLDSIKGKIVDYTAKGIPVWVNAVFYGIARGHNSEAIGVDYSKVSKGQIIFNDPWWGQGIAIPDRFITPGKNSWMFAAIRPKAH